MSDPVPVSPQSTPSHAPASLTLPDDPAPVATPSRPRALALDALRGMAILGMLFSGVVPFHNNTLPRWMYHAQEPPPKHEFLETLPGITWVDLVFPFFLFALGAAIPLALGGRLDRGASKASLVPGILWRGVLLCFFALYDDHFNPWALEGTYGRNAFWIGIGAFLLLFPILARVPAKWPKWSQYVIPAVGWVAALTLFATIRYKQPDGSFKGFSLSRVDIIIILLANASVVGSLVWLYLGRGPWIRLGILGFGLVVHFLRREPGLVHDLTDLKPLSNLLGEKMQYISWAFQPRYLKYLFIVIPGTFAGDALRRWMQDSRNQGALPGMSMGAGLKLSTLALLCFATIPVSLVGLLGRWVWPCAAVNAALLAGAFFLLPGTRSTLHTFRPETGTGPADARLIRYFYWLGFLFLVVGFAFEPYQGGIKKDNPTLSYYFVTTGLASLLMVTLTICIDVFKRRKWGVRLLVDNGQNPMIAYVCLAYVVYSSLTLVQFGGQSLMERLQSALQGPWPGALRGAILVLLASLVVSACTRLKIFWRA